MRGFRGFSPRAHNIARDSNVKIDMLSLPCAKINLGLNIVGKRPDGYHNLETVFYPIPLCDELQIETAGRDSLQTTGIPIEGNAEDNLAMRAVRLLRDEGYAVPQVKIRLRKNIPSGAGLGGGSSDAAFTIKTLNEMFGLGMSAEEAERLVSRLGADCAFFVKATPVFAEGIGDVFSPVDVDLGGLFLVLVKPDEAVSTKEAYARVKPQIPAPRLREIIGQDIATWRAAMRNDFEESVFPSHPEIARIKKELYRRGALYASMSGSGSSVFALFSEPVKIETEHFLFTSLL